MKKSRNIKTVFFSFLLMFFMILPVQASEMEKTSLADSRLVISSKREFLEFAQNCRLDKYSENLVVVLETDIDLTGNEFNGIPIFCGMFEGNHHTISGLNILENGSAKGLFRYLTEEALVQNLSLKGKVMPQGSKSIIGGLAGKNAGTVLNCSFSGEIDGKDYVGGLIGINEVTGIIENCQVEGSILGIHFVGGIAGENSGVIRECSNMAKVNTEAKKSNLEVSDITIESLTNSEAMYTITDVGGIAGSSSGVIKNCDNKGNIGYQHIGYNIGGIAGSQVGYVYNCVNQGPILGRKEVGGIVGQMEPVANLEFDKDTLQILESQLGAISATVEQSSGNIQTQINQSAADVSNQVDKLQNDLNLTTDAVSQLLEETDTSYLDEINKKIAELEELQNIDFSSLSVEEINRQIEEYQKREEGLTVNEAKEWYEQLKQWETLKLPDSDSIQAAQNSLNESMSSMNETLDSITRSGQNTMNTLTKEMQTIMNQAQSITSTIAHTSDNLGFNLTDVSDTDTENNLLAKIENCKNMGNVQADLNGGGIIGVIAVENDLDPEGELEINGEVSFNLQGELRAVILNCDNEAKISVRNQNGGGIAGWMFLGLIKDCINTGTLDALNADYIGGIAGLSTGYIRNNSAKCEISGNSYVGGIAGSGSIVSDCRSMVHLNSGNEKIGNILGNIQENYRKEENPVINNFYLCVERDFGGIDGISYSGLAEPLDRNTFLKLENLPQEFWKVKVTFINEDNTYEQILINHGSSLAPEDVPEVPEKDGYLGTWEGLETTNTKEIFFDISFKTSYTPVKGTIPSKKKGMDEKPVLLLQGDFNTTQEVALIEVDSMPKEADENKVLDVFGFVLKENEKTTGARYLIPKDVKGEDLRVFLQGTDIPWYEAEGIVDGSYLVVSLKNGENQIAILENQTAPSLWGGVILVIVVIFVLAIILERKQNKN